MAKKKKKSVTGLTEPTTRVSITMPKSAVHEIKEYARVRCMKESEVYRRGIEALGIVVPDVKIGNPYLGRPAEG